MTLTCTWHTASPRAGRIALAGDLDHDTGDGLLREIVHHLDAHPGLAALHLDCTRLGFCDTYGLAILLMAQRRLTGAGVRLHLDHRPGTLDRLLTITGTLTHLTGEPELRHEKGLDP